MILTFHRRPSYGTMRVYCSPDRNRGNEAWFIESINHGLDGLTFIGMSARKMIGVSLVTLSTLAVIVAGVAFSSFRMIEDPSSKSSSWADSSVVVVARFDVGWRYFVPVFLCGGIGMWCLVRSRSKPPRLPKG